MPRLVTGLVSAVFAVFTLGCCFPAGWVAKFRGDADPEVAPVDEAPVEALDIGRRLAAQFPAEKVCGEAAAFPAWCAVSEVDDAGWSAPAVDQRFVGLAVRVTAGETLETSLARDPQLAALSVGPTLAGFSLLSPSGPRVRKQHQAVKADILALLGGQGGPDLKIPESVGSLLGGASAAAGVLSDAPGGGGTFNSGGAWRIWRVADQRYGEAIVIAGETSGGIEVALFPLVALIPAGSDEEAADEGAAPATVTPKPKSARSGAATGASPKGGAKGPGKSGPGIKGKVPARDR